MRIGFILSKENIELSKKEAFFLIQSTYKLHSIKTERDFLIVEFESNIDIRKLVRLSKRLAFTKSAYFLVEKPQDKTMRKILEKTTRTNHTKTFAIKIHNSTDFEINKPEIISEIAKEAKMIGFKYADLQNPDVIFGSIHTNKQHTNNKYAKHHIGIQLFENTDNYNSRKAHMLPELQPTGTHPRIARAMINLAGAKKEILDPFCGAGGILIEAGLCGLNAKGIDIDSNMIKKAEKNTSFFNLKPELICKDALNYKKRVECVVTDVPYGKNSKLKIELQELIKKFLINYQKNTGTIVIGTPSNINMKKIVKDSNSNWKITFTATTYIHKSLSKSIYLLNQKD